MFRELRFGGLLKEFSMRTSTGSIRGCFHRVAKGGRVRGILGRMRGTRAINTTFSGSTKGILPLFTRTSKCKEVSLYCKTRGVIAVPYSVSTSFRCLAKGLSRLTGDIGYFSVYKLGRCLR